MVGFFPKFRKALWLALEHDVLNTAKACAYSGILMLFPTMVVLTALLARMPEGTTLTDEVHRTFIQFLPTDTMSMLLPSMQPKRIQSGKLIFSTLILSILAGLGLMLSLMDGFRRAYRQPRTDWGFWELRARALLLEPIVLVPLSLATTVLMFGHSIEHWMVENAVHELRHAVLFFWRMVRWAVALLTSVAVLGTLYHFGIKRTEHWVYVMPGAFAATIVWFPATLAFGWYVTTIANYSRFYGSFAAGIATLVWLYITSFSALLGAELNGVLFRSRLELDSTEDLEKIVGSHQ
jgi:membrane protein